MNSATKRPDRLHLGCGLTTPAGWLHVDGSWNARLARHPWLRRGLRALRLAPASLFDVPWNPDILHHDLRDPLPFPDDSFMALYCSHTLEHLYLDEARRLLRECLRVLHRGGVLRMVVPDLRALIDSYLRRQGCCWPEDPEGLLSPADRLCWDLHFCRPRPEAGPRLYRLLRAASGHNIHRWMYDGDSLARHFCWAGFAEVSAMPLRQSRIDGIEEIEEPGRVAEGAGVCVEGVKP
jgi:SAM-dependent methyltransferase